MEPEPVPLVKPGDRWSRIRRGRALGAFIGLGQQRLRERDETREGKKSALAMRAAIARSSQRRLKPAAHSTA